MSYLQEAVAEAAAAALPPPSPSRPAEAMYGMRSQSSAAHSCHQMGPWAAAGAAHLFVRPNATFQNHVHGDAPVLVSQPMQRILSYRRSEHGGHPHLNPHHHTMGASGGGGLREVAVLMRGAAAPPLGFPHLLGLYAGDGGGLVLGLGLRGSCGDSDGGSGTEQAAAAGSTARRKRRVRARRDEGAGPTSAGVETADPLALLAHLAAGGAPAPRPRHHSAWEDATAALASLDLGSSRRQGPPARKRPRVDLGGGVDGNTGS
ncbi:hypothetical protein PLESTF_001894100 [Pleodorina starrii]|nr:hypothetical protein PLESTM_000693300 [Pleodorina starrii]GLC77172.1 hypothetical protein PLESTF_001894100 [Pleodorina starrii]